VTTATTTDSVPQHMRALEQANAVRLERVAFKRRLKADGPALGALRVAHLLCCDERPAAIDSMPIGHLIEAVPDFGWARVRKLLSPTGVPELKPVGAATFRQRQAVADALDDAIRHRVTRAERREFERELQAERVG
jgi:DNA-binding transcriptional ArsR family regulator